MLQTYDFEFDRKVVARYATARDKGGYGAKAVVTHSIDSFSAFMRHPLTTGPRRLDPDAFLAFGEHALTGKFWPEQEVLARIGYVRDFLFNLWRREQAPRPAAPVGPRTRDRIWAWQQFETWIVTNQCDAEDQALVDAFLRKKADEDGNAGSTLANTRSIVESFRFLTGIPFRLLTQESVREFPWQHRNHRNAVAQLLEYGQSTGTLPVSTVLTALRARKGPERWEGPFKSVPVSPFRVRPLQPDAAYLSPGMVTPTTSVMAKPSLVPMSPPSATPLLPVGFGIPKRRRGTPGGRRGAKAVQSAVPFNRAVPAAETAYIGMPFESGPPGSLPRPGHGPHRQAPDRNGTAREHAQSTAGWARPAA